MQAMQWLKRTGNWAKAVSKREHFGLVSMLLPAIVGSWVPVVAAQDTTAGTVPANSQARVSPRAGNAVSAKQLQLALTDPADPSSPAATAEPRDAAQEAARAADESLFRLLRQADPGVTHLIDLPVDAPGTAGSLGTELPPQDQISLEEALDRTVNNSYSYKASAAQAEGAGYARSATLGQLGPALDLRGQRGREYSAPGSVIDPLTGVAVKETTHVRWDTSLILRQPVFAPGSWFDYKKQGRLAEAADLRRDDARAQLYYQTIKAYFDLLKAYALLDFAREYDSRMDQLLDYMNKRLTGGGASRIDLDRVRGRSLAAKSAVIETEGSFESSMVTLEQLTGVRARKMVMPQRMTPAVPLSSQLAMVDLYNNNPGLKAARQDIEAASAELKSARARFSPNLSIELSQSRTRGADGDPTLQVERRAMLVVTMNILNGGSDYYYQKEIGSKYVEKSATASDLERQLKQQIEVNYRTLSAIKKRSDIARQEYETNANVADGFLEQLGTGSKQLLDVLDAYQRAYQSRVDFAQLLFLQSDISYQILRNAGLGLPSASDIPGNSLKQ